MSKEFDEFLENHELNLTEFAMLWHEQNINSTKKKDILEFMRDCKSHTMTEILNHIKKIETISKPAIVRHIDFLVTINAIETIMTTTKSGRERVFKITDKGLSILVLDGVIKMSEHLMKEYKSRTLEQK